ncbi:MAG: hypothetical protein ACE5OR_05235 [bacterium]
MKEWQKVLVISFLVTVPPVPATAQHIVKEFDVPGPESRGLAWDGTYLWCADAGEDSIFKIDPASGQVTHTIFFDLNPAYGGGITWSGDGALWVTRVQYFYKLNANTGQQVTNFHCPGG